jgi:hypothetical protein
MDVKECCHGLILSAMRIGKYVTESFHDQFEILCGLEQMIYDAMANDQLYIAICNRKDVRRRFHDHFDVLYGFEQVILDDVLT